MTGYGKQENRFVCPGFVPQIDSIIFMGSPKMEGTDPNMKETIMGYCNRNAYKHWEVKEIS